MFSFILNQITYLETRFKSSIGFIYGTLGSLCFVTSNYISKSIETRHPVFQVIYLFSMQIFLYNLIICRAQGLSLIIKSTKENWLCILRGTLGSITVGLAFNSFPLIPYAEGQVLFMTGPAIAGVLAIFVLGEKYTIQLFFIAMLNLVGVIFIMRPQFFFGADEEQNLYPNKNIGATLMLLAALSFASVQVLIKKITFNMTPQVLATYVGIIWTVELGVFQITERVDPYDFTDWVLIIIVGLVEAVGHLLLGRCFLFGKAGLITLTNYSRIVFAFIFDTLIGGVYPKFLSLLGSFCILGSIFIAMQQNSKKEQSVEKSGIKENFKQGVLEDKQVESIQLDKSDRSLKSN